MANLSDVSALSVPKEPKQPNLQTAVPPVKWSEVVTRPAFREAPKEERAMVRDTYFQTVVAPSVGPDTANALWNDYQAATQPFVEDSAPSSSWGDILTKQVQNLPERVEQVGRNAAVWAEEAPQRLAEQAVQQIKSPNVYAIPSMMLDQAVSAGVRTLTGNEGETPEQTIQRNNARVNEIEKEVQGNLPYIAGDSTLKHYGAEATRSMTEMAGPMAASLATRSPVPALAAAAAVGTTDAYREQRQHGQTPGQAGMPALASGAAEVVFETIPLGEMLAAPGKGMFKAALGKAVSKIAGTAVGEGVSEMLTEMAQAGIEKGTISPDMTLEQYAKRVVDAGIIGTVAGAPFGAAGAAMDTVVRQPVAQPRDEDPLAENQPPDGPMAPPPSGPAPQPRLNIPPRTASDALSDPVLPPVDVPQFGDTSATAPSNPFSMDRLRSVNLDPAAAMEAGELPVVDVPAAPPVAEVAPEPAPRSYSLEMEQVLKGERPAADIAKEAELTQQGYQPIAPDALYNPQAGDVQTLGDKDIAAVKQPIKEDTDPMIAQATTAIARQETAAPTPAQAEAGNYKKGKIQAHGLDISIETPKGATRSGTDPDGNEWAVTMPTDYGYIRRTEGADGEHLDVYIGDAPQSPQVFVVDQRNLDGSFDEHKVMLGFPDQSSAISTYTQAFSDGRGADRIAGIKAMSIADFKDWAKNGKTTMPVSPQAIFEAGAIPLDSPKLASMTLPALERYTNNVRKIATEADRLDYLQAMEQIVAARRVQSATPLPPSMPAAPAKLTRAQMVAEKRKLNYLPQGRHLAKWIADNGGVEDSGGDLASAGMREWHKGQAFQRRLVREKANTDPNMFTASRKAGYGYSLDDWAERAWEHGFFPTRPTEAEMKEAIIISGNNGSIYAEGEGPAETFDESAFDDQNNDWLKNRAEELSVDVDGMSSMEALAAIAEAEDSLAASQEPEMIGDMIHELLYMQDRELARADLNDIMADDIPWDAPVPQLQFNKGELINEANTAGDSEAQPRAISEDAGNAEQPTEGADNGTGGRITSGNQDAGSSGADVAQASQQSTENTEAGEQVVIPGAERISDKALAERKMDEAMRAKKPQKDAGSDGGLFDTGARQQADMFDAPAPTPSRVHAIQTPSGKWTFTGRVPDALAFFVSDPQYLKDAKQFGETVVRKLAAREGGYFMPVTFDTQQEAETALRQYQESGKVPEYTPTPAQDAQPAPAPKPQPTAEVKESSPAKEPKADTGELRLEMLEGDVKKNLSRMNVAEMQQLAFHAEITLTPRFRNDIQKLYARLDDLPASDLRAAAKDAYEANAPLEGAMGMKLAEGQKATTVTGRTTSPFPKLSWGRMTNSTMKAVDQWLMYEAVQEAKSRGDEYNAQMFEANRERPQQADKDSAELYLFGEKADQPKVLPSILKPFAPSASVENTPAPAEPSPAPATEPAAPEGVSVNLPDPKTLVASALYRARKKVENAFIEYAEKQNMTDEEYAALEDYARKIESEIESRGKAEISAQLKPAAKKPSADEDGKIIEYQGKQFKMIDGNLHFLVTRPEKVAGTKDDYELKPKWLKAVGQNGIKPTTSLAVARMFDAKPSELPAKPSELAPNVSESQEPITLTKRGDFYEVTGPDAIRVANALGQAYTSRDGQPMTAIPAHTLDADIEELARRGLTAVAPTPDPKPSPAKQAKIRIWDVSVNDSYKGESFGVKNLTVDDVIKSQIKVSILRDEVAISYIETADDAKKQGYAKKLVDDLFREFPNKTIKITSTTEDGAKFFEKNYDIADGETITQKSKPESLKTESSTASPKVESSSDKFTALSKELETRDYTIADHASIRNDVLDGFLTAEQVKTLFDHAQKSADSIKAAIAKYTKDEIARRWTGRRLSRGGSETKDTAIKHAYDSILSDFHFSDTFQWSPMEETIAQAYKRLVYAQTDEMIQAGVVRRKAANKEWTERAQENAEALAGKKLETMDHFRVFIRAHGWEKLSDEQLRVYDSLLGERWVEEQARNKERKATVEGVTTTPEDLSAEVIETKHTQKGHDLFVVRLSDRVEKDVYTALNTAAKRLGGYYSSYRGMGATPGFQFTTRSAADSFVAATKGETVTSEAGKKPETRAEKLRNAGQKLIDVATEKLEQDRKVNTARRAAQAASMEDSAQRDIAEGKTMQRLADLIEAGEAGMLQNVNARTELDLLHNAMRNAMRKADHKIVEAGGKRQEGRKFDDGDGRYIEYPLPWFHIDNIPAMVAHLEKQAGFKNLAKHLQKLGDKAKKEGQSGIHVSDLDYVSKVGEAAKKWESTMGWYAEEGVARYMRAQRLGWKTVGTFRQAVREYAAILSAPKKVDGVKQAERDLAGRKWDGYFPTPEGLARRMADELDVNASHTVLEPSAGKGSLIDAVIAAGADVKNVEALEIVGDLRKLLELKGYKVVGNNFLDHTGSYDRIIMNPPFEKGQDMEHVRHAYGLLKPGGKLVAITSEGPFFRKDKKADEFRAWLDDVGGWSEQLPEGSFKDSDRSTGVATRMVVIEKPEGDESSAPMFSRGETATSTPAFKKWFGDSKVVDAEGKPLVVYHGTRSEDVNQFRDFAAEDFNEQPSFFFTDSADVASTYAEADLPDGDSPNVIPAYLAIDNPLVVDAKGASYRNIDFNGGSYTTDYIAEKAAQSGHDGVIIRNVRDDFSSSKSRKPSTLYIAFSPSQIKSVNNQGSFDPNDARILYQRGEGGAYSPSDLPLEQAAWDNVQYRLMPEESRWTATQKKHNREIKAIARKAFGDGLNVRAVDALVEQTETGVNYGNQGVYDRGTRLASIALGEFGKPIYTISHEGIHHLRYIGALDTVWGDLRRMAESTWIEKHKIVSRYRDSVKDLTPSQAHELHIEEAIAEAYADYVTKGEGEASRPPTRVETVFRKIKAFLTDLHNYLKGQGFTSWQSIFEKVSEGKLTTPRANRAVKDVRARDDMFSRGDIANSAAFKKWFGNSKVKDAYGVPMVVYHGSSDARFMADSGVFMSLKDRYGDKKGVGAFWFAESRQTARTYADDKRALDYQAAEPAVIPAYIKLENPLVVDGGGKPWREAQAIGKTSDVIEKAQTEGYDGVIIKDVRDDYNSSTKTKATTTYVVFDSRQIKSVDNQGTFDPNDARVMFSRPPAPNGAKNQRAIEKKYKGTKSKLKRWLKRNMTKEGLLGEESFELKLRKDGAQNASEYDIARMVHDLENSFKAVYKRPYSKITAKESADMRGYMSGEDVALPEAMKNRLDHLREYLDRGSAKMQDAIAQMVEIRMNQLTPAARQQAEMYLTTNGEQGRLPGSVLKLLQMLQTIESNKGSYLNRSYQAFDDPDWMEKVLDNEDLMTRAKAWIAEQYPDLSADEVTGEIRAILREAQLKGNFVSFLSSGSKVGQKDVSFLRRRKEVPAIIRELLGEYQDPKINFVRSAAKMQAWLANQNFLYSVRQAGMGMFLFEKPTGEFDTLIASEGNETMSPLDGLYTSIDFLEGMQDVMGGPNKNLPSSWQLMLAFNAVIKYGKTIGSPTTQFRNFESGVMFAVINGHWNFTHTAKAFRAISADFTKSSPEWDNYLRELIELGVLHDNPYASELRGAIEDFIAAAKMPGAAGAEKLADFFRRVYEASDDFWKINGYENEMARLARIYPDMPRPERKIMAAKRIRDGYPTYSMVPLMIRNLRRFPLMGMFVSFSWESWRTYKNQFRFMAEDYRAGGLGAIKGRGIGMIAGTAGLTAVAQATMLAMGLDDEDDEAIRDLSAPWQRNATFAYMGYDENGMPTYLDISFLDPYSYIKKPFMALTNGNNVGIMRKVVDAGKEIFEPFIGWELGAGTVFEIIFNKDFETGRQIYAEGDTAEGIATSIAKHMEKLLPGFVLTGKNFYQAAQGQVLPRGKQRTLEDEAAAFVGFRTTTLNVPTSLVYKGYEFADTERMVSGLLTRNLGNPNPITKDDIRSAYERMNYARNKLYAEMLRAVDAAKKLGMENEDIVAALRAARMSREDIGALLKGEGMPPWRMSRQFLIGTASTVLLAVPDDAGKDKAREEIIRRKQMLMQIIGEGE